MTAPIDLKTLREIAEAATPGIWDSAVWHGSNEDSWTATGPIHTFGDDPYEPLDPQSETAKRAERDSAFIASCSPSVVLALLDRIGELDKQVRQHAQVAVTQTKRVAEALKAKDEALDIATEILDEFHDNDPEADLSADRERITALRSIGRSEGK